MKLNSFLNFQKEEFWKTDFYNLNPLQAHCHTYNPPNDTKSILSHGIGMFFGNKTKNDATDKGYIIYFHEKGSFWLNRDIPDLKLLKLAVKDKKVVFFQKIFHSDLPAKTKCIKDESYSLTNCFKRYIHNKIGCSFNLFSVSNSFENCQTIDEKRKTISLLKWLQDEEYIKIAEETGCYKPCKYHSYEIEIKDQKKIDWETDWLSELYVYAGSDIVDERREYYTFDFINLMGTIGGYLGKKQTEIGNYYLEFHRIILGLVCFVSCH